MHHEDHEESAVGRARRIFEAQARHRWTMATTTAADRVARLVRLREALCVGRADLLAALQGDFGKPAAEVELTEFVPALEELSQAIRHLPRWMRPRRVPTPISLTGTRSRVHFEARGQVLVLAPWNYPFLLAMAPLVSALAAGNCVVLRPSGRTPRTARFIADLVASVLPEHEAAVLTGGRSMAQALLDLPFDHIFFTGSAAVGRTVMAAAARHLASVTLELGGKSPAIVDETADLEAAATRIAWGKFLNAGQTCVAPDYVLVHQAVADCLARELGRAIDRFYGSAPAARLAGTDLACLIDADACRRMERIVGETLAAGARLITGGRVDPDTRRMEPTVLADVPDDSAIMREEIFGPVLPLLSCSDTDAAIASVRRRSKPLALYIFSRDRRRVAAILRATTAGGTCVNNTIIHLANPHLPFGGVGESGLGRYHGRYGFETFSHARAVMTQGWPPATAWLRPPYGRRTDRILSLLRRLAAR